MLFRINFVLFISLLYFNISIAQNDAEELLKNVQEKFNTIDDLSAQITQSVNGQINLQGKIYYKKENHLRFEFKNILIISDGETAWNYNEKQNKVIITNYENEGNKILSIRHIIYEYPEDCLLSTYELEGLSVLKLVPEGDTFSFSSIELFITDDYLINKALIDDPARGKIQVDLSDYKINSNLPDSYFSFSSPEGSEVIDLR